jgi:hypothetical protein
MAEFEPKAIACFPCAAGWSNRNGVDNGGFAGNIRLGGSGQSRSASSKVSLPQWVAEQIANLKMRSPHRVGCGTTSTFTQLAEKWRNVRLSSRIPTAAFGTKTVC